MSVDEEFEKACGRKPLKNPDDDKRYKGFCACYKNLGKQLAKQAEEIKQWKAEYERVTSHFLAMDAELTKRDRIINELKGGGVL